MVRCGWLQDRRSTTRRNSPSATLTASGQGQRLRDNFVDYLNGFSPNVQDILAKFKFRDQIQTMVEADILGHLINDFLAPKVNLSPLPVKDVDGRIKLLNFPYQLS
ncbi:hypothetical protein [Zoogloea oleivorans]|uniref:hypothetical protein n=1 Tax=Zoogloea oleivorans TaxID=1552750 RepID=UPI001CA31CCC|nr:hypothetical protein [Zoogloea oleivorans]